MCDFATAFTVGSTLIGAYSQYQQGQYQQDMGEYNAAVMRNNAMIQDRMASDAITRGAQAEERQRDKVRQMIGKQRANTAAQGLLVDSGTPGALTDETAMFGEEDAQTIRVNAMNEAWGYRVNAGNYRAQASAIQSQGDAAASAGTMGAFGTLLTGGAKIGDKYGWWQQPSTTTASASGYDYGSSKLRWWES